MSRWIKARQLLVTKGVPSQDGSC